MSSIPIVEREDIMKVADMTVEPSYISEIARKLRDVDPQWKDMNHEVSVQIVSRAVYVLEQDERVVTQRPEYGSFGGQKESSPKYTLSGDSREERNTWKEYTIVHNHKTDYQDIRPMYEDYVDPDVTISEKREIYDYISRMGNNMAKYSEAILTDQLRDMIVSADEFVSTDYNDPGPDLYIQGAEFESGSIVEDGLAIEISVRWVNPLGTPYITSKASGALDLEEEYGVPVDLVILAPRYTLDIVQKYIGSRIVDVRRLPMVGDGNPLIVSDPFTEQISNIKDNVYGDEYPVVDEQYENLQEDIESVFRDMNVITESDYRKEIAEIILSEV